ncbi:hypothetical protein F5X99DRAFT_203998 [Biscogniauxia marginata]|nr:hypothetical protein F5X99DRAFT_203998 [Biscogniauxia marginata]
MLKLVCFLPLRFVMAALESTRFVHLHFLHQTRHFSSETLSGLLNPAVQSVHPTPAAARKHTGSRPLFSVLDVELRQIEIRQRELKTEIFHLSRSGRLCVRRSRLRPRRPGPPFSA